MRAPHGLEGPKRSSYAVSMKRVLGRSVQFVFVLWLVGASVSTLAQLPPTAPADVPEASTLPHRQDAIHATEISWKTLAPYILRDQRRVWVFPWGVAHGKHWAPTAGLVLATAGLIALDAQDAPYFRRTQRFHEFNQGLSSTNTIAGMAVVPLSSYAIGLVRRSRYAQQTAELSAEAVVDAEIPALVMRDVSRRIRPRDIPSNGDFADTWFRRNKGPFYLGPGGFPSGHTIAAFSIATVFAERYRRHHWVPWVAYGLAGLVGISRITLQDHFPSDVFAGAVLGYAITHYVVLRNH